MGRRGTECATDTGAAWRRFRVASALCAALLWAPAAAAADLLISDLSDGIYDPSPVGGQVTYHVSLENGDVDTATDVVAIFDLPAGATAVALPGFCTAAATNPVRVHCNIGTLTGGSPRDFDLTIGTAGLTPGDVYIHGAIGFAAGLPGAGDAISGLDVSTHPFFDGDSSRNNNVTASAPRC